MHFLRSAIFAFGIMGLAAACGGSNKGAEEPATTEAPAENPCAAENPCDMGMEGEGAAEENPCAMEENPCAAAEEGEGGEW